MSVRNSYTTADYIPRDTAMSLVKNLYANVSERTPPEDKGSHAHVLIDKK